MMELNKYDLVEEISCMLLDTCEGCFMKNECKRFYEKHENTVLCNSPDELEKAIIKKYNL